jgi:hypothetical protein
MVMSVKFDRHYYSSAHIILDFKRKQRVSNSQWNRNPLDDRSYL